MAGLPRRTFLKIAGAVAAAWGLPTELVAPILAQTARPAEVETTLVATITTGKASTLYKPTIAAPGESHLVREDILLGAPNVGRTNSRRSLLYFGQFTDAHIIDAQSPARVEPTQEIMQNSSTVGGCRPQETLTVHVLNQMVVAMNRAASSPVTGAPMALAVITGDSTDSHATTELHWYIGCLDGKKVLANSGGPAYEGVQVWGEAEYAYHPEDPSDDMYGKRGYPAIPGMLEAATQREIECAGLQVPWYATYGNHDTVFLGTIEVSYALRQLAMGGRKASLATALAGLGIAAGAANSYFDRQFWASVQDRAIGIPGLRKVSRDPERRIYEIKEFMQAHLRSGPKPGPVGHGFTPEGVDRGETYWAHDVAPHVRVIGMNTCNLVTGADGSMPDDEFRWLEQQLRSASSRWFAPDGTEQSSSTADKLIIVCSHHTSYTMDNTAEPPFGSQELRTGDEVVELLLRYPNVVAWVNGHTHWNRITSHPSPHLPRGHGFWEINTAACIDWPQQARLIEIVDNRDGTLSILGTLLDHASSVAAEPTDLSTAGLASLSRELAANQWFVPPTNKPGSVFDRNIELPLRQPFDLKTISDESLAAAQARQRSRLIRPGGQP